MKTGTATIFIAVAAIALMASIFFHLIPDEVLPDNIRWLDFAVMTVIIAIFTGNVLYPFIDLSDKSHKEVAALGLRWSATGWYSALAFLFMLCNIIFAWQNGGKACSFSLQIIVQAAFLLFFMMGLVSSQAAMRKTQAVFNDEKDIMRGKADVCASLAELLSSAENKNDIQPEYMDRIRRIVSEGRYITPSSGQEAIEADRTIINGCISLESALSDFPNSKSIIEDRLLKLENYVLRRRRL